MRVVVLYNEPTLAPDHPDALSEHEILDTVHFVANALREAGHEVAALGAGRDPGVLIQRLREQRPEVVFNLFEGAADQSVDEPCIASLLEWLAIPFTGSPSQTLALARCKHLTKYLLRGAGLLTPAALVVDRLPLPETNLAWPVIIKPATQDASVGLDQGSVVTSPEALERRVADLLARYGPPVLIEEYIAGREFNVGLIECPELRVLHLGEIVFKSTDPSVWPIVTYDGKWKPGSPDYDLTPPQYAPDLDAEAARSIASLGMQAYRLLGCRDYARVDFRLSRTGQPFILEVNPNPDFNPNAGLAGGLAAARVSHAGLAVELVQNAWRRSAEAPCKIPNSPTV